MKSATMLGSYLTFFNLVLLELYARVESDITLGGYS
jgi:hypothetical protein